MKLNEMFDTLANVLGEATTETVFDAINFCLIHHPWLFDQHDRLSLLYHMSLTSYAHSIPRSSSAIDQYFICIDEETRTLCEDESCPF